METASLVCRRGHRTDALTRKHVTVPFFYARVEGTEGRGYALGGERRRLRMPPPPRFGSPRCSLQGGPTWGSAQEGYSHRPRRAPETSCAPANRRVTRCSSTRPHASDVRAKLGEHEHELLEMNSNSRTLQQMYNKPFEFKLVLSKLQQTHAGTAMVGCCDDGGVAAVRVCCWCGSAQVDAPMLGCSLCHRRCGDASAPATTPTLTGRQYIDCNPGIITFVPTASAPTAQGSGHV